MPKHYHYPIPLEAAQEFCHPDPQHPCHQPFVYQDKVACYNLHIAMLVETHLDVTHESEKLTAVFDKINFGEFEIDTHCNSDKWAPLDKARGGLWKRGEQDHWFSLRGQLVFNLKRFVIVGRGVIVPKSALQLVSKLPRVEVFTDQVGGNLPFRFNGGKGFIKGVYTPKSRRTLHHIFQPEDLKDHIR